MPASKTDSRSDHGEDLTIALLGPFALRTAGQDAAVSSRKGQALLAYLARRAGTRVPRSTLVGLLWPDSADEQARASLRQTVSVVRKALGPRADRLTSDAGGLELRPDQTDVALFEAAADSGQDAASAAHYAGPFLEGFPPVSPEFDRWVEAERGALQSRFVAALLGQADAAEADSRTEDVIALSSLLLALDPLQEHVHRRLIAAFRRQKRFDAALRQFDDLERLLEAELGVRPEPPTLELIAEVRKERRAGAGAAPAQAAAAAEAAPALPDRPSIAVPAFRALSSGDEALFLGEGIAEDIVTELSRNGELMVVAARAPVAEGAPDRSPVDTGKALGVRFLVGGSVRMAGRRLRVTAHLVRCATGEEIWSERYDREVDDIFDLQTEIARSVTQTVAGQIAQAEIASVGQNPTESLEGYVLVARGMHHLFRVTRDDLAAAASCFTRATELDPGFARAWGLRAIADLWTIWYFSFDPDFAQVRRSAERAVTLDPREPKGLCALGILDMLDHRFDAARHHFAAGLNENPNDEMLLLEHGRFLMYDDQPEAGLVRIRAAMRRNPFHPMPYWIVLGRCLHTLGRFDEALEAFGRAVPETAYVHAYRAACYARTGNTGAARAEAGKALEKRPDFSLSKVRPFFPYRNPDTLEAYLATFEGSGLG